MNTTIILDFDRVLFDTDAFNERLEKEGLGDIPRGRELLEAIEEKGIDWEEFVNEEALEFLEDTEHTCIIVSSYFSRHRMDNTGDDTALELFQREKIRRSGLEKLAKKVEVTGELKKDTFKELQEAYGEDMVLVDDHAEHIQEAKELGYTAVWFRTPKNIIQPKTPEGMPQHVESDQEVTSFRKFIEFLEKRKEAEDEQ